MERVRRPFQGVWNVVRFNWPFYLLSVGLTLLLLLSGRILDEPHRGCTTIAGLVLIGIALLSSLVTFYIYDLSGLYRLHWSGQCPPAPASSISTPALMKRAALLQERFPDSELIVFDFFDPQRHTEASIRRARNACPPFPGTRSMSTSNVPLPEGSADRIFVTLSAHEIRDSDERIAFFKALKRCLKATGQIVVTEHLRDLPNFLAYTIGFFHFLSVAAWNKTFREAELRIAAKCKTTPFITTFVLEKHGTAS